MSDNMDFAEELSEFASKHQNPEASAMENPYHSVAVAMKDLENNKTDIFKSTMLQLLNGTTAWTRLVQSCSVGYPVLGQP